MFEEVQVVVPAMVEARLFDVITQIGRSRVCDAVRALRLVRNASMSLKPLFHTLHSSLVQVSTV